MKYFERALATPGTTLRPAVRTSSPLAVADQRLHLEGFAATIEPVGTSSSTPERTGDVGLDELENVEPARGQAHPLPTRRAKRAATAPARPMSTTLAQPAAPRSPGHSHREGQARDATPNAAPPGAGSTVATTDGSPPSAKMETVVARESDPLSAADSSQAENGDRTTTLSSAPQREEWASPQPQANDAGSGALSDVLSKVSQWLSRTGVAAREAELAPPAERRRLEHTARTIPAIDAQGPTSSRAAAPARLEIGTIEVEVIAPAPAPTPRRERAQVRTAPDPAPASRSFGWRQR